MQKPHIDYPCNWSYRLIGTEEQLLREAAVSVVSGKTYTIEESNRSSGGKYVSLNLSVTVDDEDERLRFYSQLKKDPAVAIIL